MHRAIGSCVRQPQLLRRAHRALSGAALPAAASVATVARSQPQLLQQSRGAITLAAAPLRTLSTSAYLKPLPPSLSALAVRPITAHTVARRDYSSSAAPAATAAAAAAAVPAARDTSYLTTASSLPAPPCVPAPRVNADAASARTLQHWVRAHRGFVSPSVHIGPVLSQPQSHPTDASAAGVSARADESNWGVVATQDVPAGALLMSVPVGLCLFPLEHPLAAESVSPLPAAVNAAETAVTAQTATRDGSLASAPLAIAATGASEEPELVQSQRFFAVDAASKAQHSAAVAAALAAADPAAGAAIAASAANAAANATVSATATVSGPVLPQVKPLASPAPRPDQARLPADVLAHNPTAAASAEDPAVPTLRRHARDQGDAFYQAVATLAAGVPDSFFQLRLALRLLAERAADTSVFAPYVNCLPATFPTHPLFFSQDAMQALQYQPLVTETTQRARTLHQLATALNTPDGKAAETTAQRAAAVAFNGFDVSAADLAWAVSAVTSRAFRAPPLRTAQYSHSYNSESAANSSSTGPTVERKDIEVGESFKGEHLAMIPLIDMLNHSLEPNAYSSFLRVDPTAPGKGGYHVALRALRPIKAGEELTLNYFRPRTNSGDAGAVAAAARAELEDRAATGYTTAASTASGSAAASKSVRPLSWGANTAAAAVAQALVDPADLWGVAYTESSDETLVNFGFVPAWNARDRFRLELNVDLLKTAMTMALDLGADTEKLAAAAAAAATGSGDGTVPVTTALQAQGLVAAAPGEFTDRQRELIDTVLSLPASMPLYVGWGGPSPALAALCRVLAAGTCRVNAAGDREQSPLIDTTLEFERARVESEARVEAARAVAATARRADDLARMLWATRGRILPSSSASSNGDAAGSEIEARDALAGWGADPLTAENEAGARAVLYKLLVLHTAMFRGKLSRDAEAMAKAADKKDAAGFIALQVARGKKQILTHALMMLARDLELDESVHAWHKSLV